MRKQPKINKEVENLYDRLANQEIQNYLDACICLGHDPSLEKEFGRKIIDLIKINYGIDKKEKTISEN